MRDYLKKIKSIIATKVSKVVQIQNTIPDMIDLGLSVKWAANNIGANPGTTPESYYGSYFAWGEKETKSKYNWKTYVFGESYPFNKYDTDGKTVLEASDDVATTIYGSNYRMPTIDEMKELIDGTDNEWITNYNGISGLNGYKFMKKSDHSVFIFIPAAGFLYALDIDDAGHDGAVWFSSVLSNYPGSAQGLYFSSNDILAGCEGRCFGCSVRAVRI